MSEWVELSVGHLVESITVRRNDIYRILGGIYGECTIYLRDGSRIVLAGEYDIVRDEIIGGKWSRKRWLTNLSYWDYESYSAGFETGEQFGCIHWCNKETT